MDKNLVPGNFKVISLSFLHFSRGKKSFLWEPGNINFTGIDKTKVKSSFHFVTYLKLLQFVLLGFHKNLFASLELFHI